MQQLSATLFVYGFLSITFHIQYAYPMSRVARSIDCYTVLAWCQQDWLWGRRHGLQLAAIIFRHYSDVIMGRTASQITSLTIVYSTVYSGADQRKHQSSASLAFLWGIHRWPVNSLHKWRSTRKMFPFADVIMVIGCFKHRLGLLELRWIVSSRDRYEFPPFYSGHWRYPCTALIADKLPAVRIVQEDW